MKVLLIKEKLIELLNRVEKIASRNTSLPILQCALLTATPKQLSLRATNLEIGVDLTTPAQVEEEGVVAVSAGTLSTLVSTFPSGVEVTLRGDEGTLGVYTVRGAYKLPLFSVEEFPNLPTITPESRVVLSGSVCAQALKTVLPAVSTSTIKPELSSVYLKSEGNTLVVVATDSFRLIEKKVVLPVNQTGAPILIPQRNVHDLVRLLEHCGDQEVTLASSAHQAVVEYPGMFATLRLTDGTYPNYTAILPTTFSTETTLLKFDLLQALRGASVFANAVNQARLTIDPKAASLTIHTESKEVGESTTTLDAQVEGKGLEVSFNLRYLLDALQLIATDSLTFSFTGSDTPAIMRGVGDPSLVYLVMPMNR